MIVLAKMSVAQHELTVFTVALVIPAAFAMSIDGANATQYNEAGVLVNQGVEDRLLSVSRGTAIVLLLAWFV